MYASRILALILIAIFSVCCNPRNNEKSQDTRLPQQKSKLTGTISIRGAYALYPLVSKWADDFMKVNPGVSIEVLKSGTGKGIADLLEGKCQLAMISRPLSNEEITAGIQVIPVARDGVAPIVSQKNPYLEELLRKGLSTDEFICTFTGEKQVTWGELLETDAGETVITYNRNDESGAAEVWAEFLYKTGSDLKGKEVSGDEEMIKSVSENPLSIGFCNFSYAFDAVTGEKLPGIQIVPFDLDFDNLVNGKEVPYNTLEKAQRSVWLGIYPKTLCRELTLGSMGKPAEGLTTEFIKYILTEGQNDVKSSSLCELNNAYVRYYLEMLVE